MVEANYSFTGINKTLSAKQASVFNLDAVFSPYNYLLSKEPDYYVYLYNVSDQHFKVTRMPVLRDAIIPGKLGEGISKEAFDKLKESGRATPKWVLATKLPSPVVIPRTTTESDQVTFDAEDGRRFAMDIVNPENLGIDQDAVIDPTYVFSQGNNLGAKGVFWSRNFPPTEEEVKAAEKRLGLFYEAKLREARAVETSAPAKLLDMLSPEHHFAADHFGEQFSWHGKKVKAIICDQCGERTRENAAFHKMEDGGLCILSWPRAVTAGVRSRAQAFDATGDPQFAPRETVAPKINSAVDPTDEKE